MMRVFAIWVLPAPTLGRPKILRSSPFDTSAPGSDWADSSATSDRPGQDWGCPQACPLWDWWFPILFFFHTEQVTEYY